MLRVGLHGILKGRNYRLIAVAERYEVNTSYYWFEYTLMDDEGELAFLSTYDGHWNLLKPVPTSVLPTLATNPNQPGVSWEEDQFERFSRYVAKYNYASGEFQWESNLRKGVDCVEYICPPRLLAVEINTNGPGETDIFGGEYILPGDVSKAFLNGEALPKPVGIAPAQPPRWNIDARRFLIGTLVFCVLALIIQTMYVYSRKQQPVFSERLQMDTGNVNKPLISPSFRLEGQTSNMEVQLVADVNNSWCEVEVNLVNEQTGKETAFVVGTEYYSGVSEGESWSEGSRLQKEFVCSVAPGNYHFVTTFSKDSNAPSVSLDLTVWWDVPTWWNAVIVSLVMTLIAVVIQFVQRSFEAERWAGSNVIKHRN
ncbi:DUF4178 domain-containing protein [Chitinophaga arvensicola]|nr:DUF4178 domain-containing protein [Chitinophaga arvensicola]